ncbi:MAG: class 1 fructose-bisphosphatase [Chitinophagaceae bacterium]|nr:class 1 fructose-bisphosphatase [Chitinophagaceae bacterium]
MLNEYKIAAPVGTALDRFIAKNQTQFQYATGELSQLLRDIALAGKIINREINRAGLAGIEGSFGDEPNVQGEIQQKLDVIAEIRFIRALTRGGQTCAIISEEEEDIIYTGNNDAKYIVAIDPLDGSSNIDVNVSVGTIFSIYKRKTMIGSIPDRTDVLQPGTEQVVAGYILYGSSTVLVFATQYGVNGFTYEPSLGEYFLSHPNIQIKPEGNIYSINEGNAFEFSKSTLDYLESCKKKKMTARYIGSLVADFHRNLIKGGIYIYPETIKNPNGKLRLMYECNPIAYIAQKAGGIATDGKNSILEIIPHSIHQRSPFYVGSSHLVSDAMKSLS